MYIFYLQKQLNKREQQKQSSSAEIGNFYAK